MKNALFALACLFAWGLSSTLALAQGDKMSKTDAKRNKGLMATWSVESLQKGSRLIDIKAIAGEVLMHFYPMEKKDKDTGKKFFVYKYKMEGGGFDRIFDYKIEGDSIKFIGVNGWNDLKIIEMDASKLVVDQLMDGDLIRYNMILVTKLKGAPGAEKESGKGKDKDKKKK